MSPTYWDNYPPEAFEKTAKAVVARNPKDSFGYILFTEGPAFREELEES
jgi:hypothetical protein